MDVLEKRHIQFPPNMNHGYKSVHGKPEMYGKHATNEHWTGKKDSVEISREGRRLASVHTNVNEAKDYAKVNTPMEHIIFNALNGKVDYAADVATNLANMIDPRQYATEYAWICTSDPKELEAIAANREAGRDLANYIAENYFDDPEEAKKFMEKINKAIELSELRDQGYSVSYDYVSYENPLSAPKKPEPPSDYQRFLEQEGYIDRWNELIRMPYTDETIAELKKIRSEFYEMMANANFKNPVPYNVYDAPVNLEQNLFFHQFLEQEGYITTTNKSRAELEKMANEFREMWDNFKKNLTPYKAYETLTWEELRETNCDPRYSMYSEENKAWYAEFDAKVNLAQSIIDNAKKITDFSGNEKWNAVMNLLPKAA